MRFEAEFRIETQRRMLESLFSSSDASVGSLNSQLEYSPSTWVKLLEQPTPFSHDEALLLCQCSENQWLAWIPDFGEILLNTTQFCIT